MGFLEETKQPKMAANGNFQVVGSHLYAHYPYIFLSFI